MTEITIIQTPRHHDGKQYTLITESFTHSVKINGETRETEFSCWYVDGSGPRRRYYSKPVFAFRIGQGAKLHRGSISAWEFDSEQAARKVGYRSDSIFCVGGRVFGLQMFDTIRNRRATAVGWADQFVQTEAATKQNYYGSI